jgi:hypothetical protein
MSKADDRAELNRLLSTFKGDVQRCRPGQSRMRAMPNSSTLLADKKSVHAELMRLALAGQIILRRPWGRSRKTRAMAKMDRST